MFLAEQAQQLKEQIEELEMTLAVEKEEFEANQRDKKNQLAAFKRVLKTTESAMESLGQENE